MKPIIEVNNLSKKYKYGESQPYYTLRDSLTAFAKNPFGLDKEQEALAKNEFWALKDISFKLNQGDAVGIIGPNGAGKSTLLKILSRITPPTSGEAILRGRVGSLLEVGTGFQQELTGRENIYLNGAILGMTRREINRKFDEIVDFSGVEKFIDTPVKHYSSGMYMRLAFAVAANLESEILIVDEVLAVGDVEFQKKCLGKMDDIVANEGRTVIFVSHNMSAVSSLCKLGIYLNNGRINYMGGVDNAINRYSKSVEEAITTTSLLERSDRVGSGLTKFTNIKFNDGKEIYSGKPLLIKVSYKSSGEKQLENCRVSVSFSDSNGNFLFICSTELYYKDNVNLDGRGSLECIIDTLPLTVGDYFVDLFFEANLTIRDWVRKASKFTVLPGNFYEGIRQSPVGFEGKGVLVNHVWRKKI